MVSLLFLLELPFVPQLANFVWPSSDDSLLLSPEYCLEYIWDKGDCWKSLIVKLLGVAMIAGAFLNKAPVLINVMTKQSVAGLSKAALYSEVIVYSNAFFYGLRTEGLPFTSYGENGALLLQTVLLVACCWKFSQNVNPSEWILALVVYSVYSYICMELVPQESISYLMQSLVPINLYAKGVQIVKIFQEGHTGNQSVVTLTMNIVGTTIRVGTTLGESVIDTNLLLSHASSAALNGTLLGQYFYYQTATAEFWKRQEQDDKKKKA
mmetsp:Transcript_9031/g.13149  ORF Transcript_9031/g.13149 Transcript_9031/m.13149 type:complete len:266 (+) Transcript_9031:143-940(+)|eukprot:CAMPEP_0194213966 /NCGR_PEP_ID=MMETSP0156-20130528/14927_1 /TAXON_ID=33649 /ORGANISM="Thalassionema nitzschioides, Strain L26-B" /LENGTH=265 /DNA_ID=CAMNT_0038942121 /DNA_START=90 /DNA_END=887 /DNA_ORIENTATION=+